MSYEHFERSIYGYRLQKYLETATLEEVTSIKEYMCKALLEAYKAVSASYVFIDLVIPGERGKSPGEKRIEDPRQPGDEPDEESPIKVYVGEGYKDEQKRILSEALRWGCEWAQNESQMLAIERKTRINNR